MGGGVEGGGRRRWWPPELTVNSKSHHLAQVAGHIFPIMTHGIDLILRSFSSSSGIRNMVFFVLVPALPEELFDNAVVTLTLDLTSRRWPCSGNAVGLRAQGCRGSGV